MNEEIDWSKLTLPATEVKIGFPRKANWRFYFGDTEDVYFQFFIKNPPNRLQRWLFRKVFGIKWEPVSN